MGGGAGVLFPYDVEKEFGTKGSVPVQATIDTVAYRGSLMNCGMSHHTLGVLKGVREQIGKGPGDMIDVVVWKDESERNVAIPAAFKALLKKEGLLAGFEKLSYTHRKEYVRWIEEAKKEETRQRRHGKGSGDVEEGREDAGVKCVGAAAEFDTAERFCETQNCCPLGGTRLSSRMCRSGGIGRRAWFRSTYSQGCGGSSPFFGTNVLLSF